MHTDTRTGIQARVLPLTSSCCLLLCVFAHVLQPPTLSLLPWLKHSLLLTSVLVVCTVRMGFFVSLL